MTAPSDEIVDYLASGAIVPGVFGVFAVFVLVGIGVRFAIRATRQL